MNNAKQLYLRAIRGPILLITVGILFAIHQAGVLSISRSWPLILIVAGFLLLAERLSAAPQPGMPGSAGQPQAAPYAAPQPFYGRSGRFLARRSVAGPLVVILVGILFLLQTLSPTFSIARLAAEYWPYVLIAWGFVQLIEVSVYAAQGRLAPNYGASGGGSWVLVVFICLLGSGMFAFHRSDHWWYHSGYRSGIAVFGTEHDYSVPPVQRVVGSSPHVVIQGFRGDAKISGVPGTMLLVSGHKAIRAMDLSNADRANRTTPVEVLVRGDEVTVRCNAYGDQNKIPVTTDIQLTVPSAASIEFDGLGGDVNLSSIGGDVRLTGRGGDVQLQKVGGKVTVEGSYEGMISLRDVTQPIHVDNMGTHLDLQGVPGEVKIDRGTLSAQDVVGPVKVNTDATDVTLQNFTQGLELSVGRGDVNLKPSQIPLGKMNIHTRSGDIDLRLPQNAMFTIAANTRHGDIENDFGGALTEQDTGRGARLQGAIGTGPNINLTTDRGTITVRKGEGSSSKGLKTNGEGEPAPAGNEVSL